MSADPNLMPDVSLMKFFVDEVFAELKDRAQAALAEKEAATPAAEHLGGGGRSLNSPNHVEKAKVVPSSTEPQLTRCPWARDDLARRYHDEEWGVPLHDDHRLFEFIVLEGAQAGLSWDTILRKRASYREAFDNFDPALIARYDQRRIERLLKNALHRAQPFENRVGDSERARVSEG